MQKGERELLLFLNAKITGPKKKEKKRSLCWILLGRDRTKASPFREKRVCTAGGIAASNGCEWNTKCEDLAVTVCRSYGAGGACEWQLVARYQQRFFQSR